MNHIWYKIYGVFSDDLPEIPLEVWRNRNEAIAFAKTENKILKRKVLKVRPIAIDINASEKLLGK